ncbi:hypothetical protein NGI46_08130 [Peribacillus butanolivorans]|uniref:hypothetical protein n=1 Tax=Peribacillus butanolivorans TaxID=421767 RepID=UPI00207C9C73|nr:hypothetical protein [Peribacillus butanolivorans]MCO0597435.1 hypothetical protein [Peribacillus butanolivorans]
MDIKVALVQSGACASYAEACERVVTGDVKLNGKVIDYPWRLVRGGFYEMKVRHVGVFRFNVRRGKIDKLKAKKVAQ